MDYSVLIIYRTASLRATICLHVLPSSIRMRESIDTVNNSDLWMPTSPVWHHYRFIDLIPPLHIYIYTGKLPNSKFLPSLLGCADQIFLFCFAFTSRIKTLFLLHYIYRSTIIRSPRLDFFSFGLPAWSDVSLRRDVPVQRRM